MTIPETTAYTDRERHAIANYERESDRYSRTWNAIAAAAPEHRPTLLDLEALSNSKSNAFMATAHARLARMLPHLDDVIALACWADQLPNLAAYQPWQAPDHDAEVAQLLSATAETPAVAHRLRARHTAPLTPEVQVRVWRIAAGHLLMCIAGLVGGSLLSGRRRSAR